MPNRRDFILQSAVVSALATGKSAAAPRSLRMLVLGGTGRIGPRFVHYALSRGHKVSAFVRRGGADHADLPAEVERLLGDRNGDLESIRNRDWDAVLDLATYGPIWVRTLGEALKGRVKHYMFISTNAVYDNAGAHEKTDEHSAVVEYDGSVDPYSLTKPNGIREYGGLKVLCEREAERQFPGRTLIFRPGWLTGPGNQAHLAFSYWSARMQHGGEMLAAGDPSTPVQFADVRDLAEWSIRMIEENVTGIYNVLGPSTPMTLAQLIDAARDGASTSLQVTWVPSSLLAAQKDKELWSNVLFWTFESDGYAGMMRMSIERALANGFTTRPVSVTLADTFAWYRRQPMERQADLLKLGNAPIPWSVYLEREGEVLAAVHRQQTGTSDS